MTRRGAPALDGIEYWVHEPGEIGDRVLSVERRATERERSALRAALDLLACDELVARYALRRAAGGRLLLEGTVQAFIVQACVISAEPVEALLEATIAVELRPASEIEPSPDVDPMAQWETEPLEEHGRVPIGRLVYEHVATALDPYPRKPGAALEPVPEEAPDRSSPFAALAKLKREG